MLLKTGNAHWSRTAAAINKYAGIGETDRK